MKFACIFILNLCLIHSFGYIIEPGPQIKATVGEIWPKPKFQQKSSKMFFINPNSFEFVVVGSTCDILQEALIRYKEILLLTSKSIFKGNDDVPNNNIQQQSITNMRINLTASCEINPHSKMDEWYYLASSGRIISHSIWGILRGLESFSQIVTPSANGMLQLPDVRIYDSPRFPYRGLLLDTSRHYISMENILKVLDGMAYNKLNVFHWHIVDDQSFPYESAKFPELAEKGAYMPWMTYSQKNVSDVIEYARMRGIRVIAEFDVPGHTRSWGNSHPEILTQCGKPYEGKMGPINPINETSFTFLEQFFTEIMEVFPDKYVHLGGDEVGFECWESNSEITKYIHTNRMSYSDLKKQFMERVSKIITDKEKIPMVWQEAMENETHMPLGTIIQVWLGDWRKLFSDFTASGHKVLLSECWYLDHLKNGGDWVNFYNCEPQDFTGTEAQKKLVLGGEACMWSEVVSDRNVLQRIFPRASAAAERLWSQADVKNTYNAQRRIEEHTCRMVLRGIPAQPPNGPSYC